MHHFNVCSTLAIVTFLALTDLQNDRLITLAIDCILHIVSAVQSVWDVVHPLLIVFVSTQIVYYQIKAKEARKVLTDKLDEAAKTSKVDREKILKLNTDALNTANGHNEKIAAVMELAKPLIDKKNEL